MAAVTVNTPSEIRASMFGRTFRVRKLPDGTLDVKMDLVAHGRGFVRSETDPQQVVDQLHAALDFFASKGVTPSP